MVDDENKLKHVEKSASVKRCSNIRFAERIKRLLNKVDRRCNGFEPSISNDVHQSKTQYGAKTALRSKWKEFLDKTGLEGFTHLNQAENNIEYSLYSLWALVILVAVLLTIRDISHSIDSYMDEGTVAEVEVVHSSEIKLNPTICIGLQVTRLVDGPIWKNATNAKQVLNEFSNHKDILSFWKNVSATTPEGPLEETFGNELKQFIGLTAQLIINIVYLENRLSDNDTVANITKKRHFGVIRYQDDGLYIDDKDNSSEAMKTVNNFYNERNVSIAHLWKYIGSIFCRAMRVNLGCGINLESGTWIYTNTSICEPEAITWFGYEPFNAQGNFLCINASYEEYMSFKTNSDTCHVTVRPQHVFGPNFNSVLNAAVYLDFTGGRAMTRTTTNNLVCAFGQVQQFFLTILGRYESISTKNKRCSTRHPYMDCRGELRVGDGLRLWPNNSVPHLSGEHCSEMQIRADTDPSCSDKCFELCTQTIYGNQMRTLDEGYANDGRVNVSTDTGFVIKFDTFMHPLFRKLKVGFDDLLTNLGGNVGFWIGACIVSFVYLLVWIVKLFLNIFVQFRQRTLAAETAASDTHFSHNSV